MGRYFFPFLSDCEIEVEVWGVGRFEEPSRKTRFVTYLFITSPNSLLLRPAHSNLLGHDFVGFCAAVQVHILQTWPLMPLV